MSETLDALLAVDVLDEMPICVLLLNNGSISWVNRALATTLHVDKDELIGLNRGNAQKSAFGALFDDSEQLCLTQANEEQLWLNRQCFPVQGDGLEVQIFTNVTYQVQLERERNKLAANVQALETKDRVTGLFNRNAILQSLDTQVSRSRRYKNPLSLLRLSLESSASGEELNEIVKGISQALKDQLRWADQIGMLDAVTFLIILPETSLSNAKELATKLANDRTVLSNDASTWNIKVGAATWQQGDDPHKLLNRLQVDQELNVIALLS